MITNIRNCTRQRKSRAACSPGCANRSRECERDPQPSTLNPFAVRSGPSTLNSQPSTSLPQFSHRPYSLATSAFIRSNSVDQLMRLA